MRVIFKCALSALFFLCSFNAFAAVAIARSGSSGYGDLTNNPSFAAVQVDTAGDYIYVAYMFRDVLTAEIAAPTWNGQTFTQLANIVLPTAAREHRLKLFRLKTTSSGTFSIVASNTEYVNTAGFYAVVTGVDATTPEGTIQSQQAWTTYSSPSLVVTDGATGDLFFEVLGAGGYDKDFNDTSAVTWTAGNSQTGVINQHSTNTGSGTPNIILATKAGASGSQTLSYAESAGVPGYAHIAFAIKAAAAGTTVTPSAGSLALTGSTPTVTTNNNVTVSPTTGSIALTGATPTITNPGYTWYTLPAPGSYDSNSILAGQTYPTGSWLRVVTDWAHITSIYATGPLQNDINDYSTAASGYTGSDTATYEIKTPALATSQYTVTASINGAISLGPTAASLVFTGSTPTVNTGNNIAVFPSAASLALTGSTPTFAATQNRVVAPSASILALAGGIPVVLINGIPVGGNKTSLSRSLIRSLSSQLSR